MAGRWLASWLLATLVAFVWSMPAGAVGPEGWRGPGPAEWIGDLSPIGPEDWSYDRAAHLLERAGFGGTPEEVARLAALTPEAAVALLLDYPADRDELPPFEESGIYHPGMEPFPASRADAVRMARANGEALGVKVKPGGERPLQPVVNKFFYWLRADALESVRLGQWWAERMVTNPHPLQEKMALFWHGHFATSSEKVRDYRKMHRQLRLFHAHGSGNFRDLVVAVAQDPAMLVFLDAAENVKGMPNENFGREVLELFTMGIGNYTEQDIREASRAFTGWTNDGLTFVVDADRHDDGEKTFLGRTGNFDGVDIIDIALDHDSSARFIAGKLYRFFANDEPDPALLDALGRQFRADGYELKPLLRTIFLARDFYSPASYAAQVKSPVHLVVSTYRKLGVDHLPGIPDFNTVNAALGQELLYPPNVAGWEGGRSWITPATLVERGNFAAQLLFPDVDAFEPPDRRMPEIYREVGEKIAAGEEIGTATVEGGGMAMANEMAAADEAYNTRYAGYHGYLVAFQRVKPIPRHTASLDLAALVEAAALGSAAEIVDHFLARLLRVPLAPDHRDALVAFLTDQLGTEEVAPARTYLEEPLRLLVHLIMSTPEYQLS